MDVRLPNGYLIKNVPEGTSKEAIMEKAISAGLATAEDFGGIPESPVESAQAQPMPNFTDAYGAPEEGFDQTVEAMRQQGVEDLRASVDPNAMIASQEKYAPNIYTGERPKPHVSYQEAAKGVSQDPAFAKTKMSIGEYIEDKTSSWADSIGKDWDDSASRISRNWGRFKTGVEAGLEGELTPDMMTPTEAGIHMGASVINFGFDAIFDTLVTVAGTAGDGVSLIMPDYAEGVIKQAAKDTFNDVLNSELGQEGLMKLSEGLEAYNQWALKNPREAEGIESIVDIGSLVLPATKVTKAKPAVTTPKTKLAKAGEALESSWVKRTANDKNAKLIGSWTDVTKDKDVLQRTGKNGIITLTPMEENAVKWIPRVEGYSPRNSAPKNLGAINDGINVEIKRIDGALQNSTGRVNVTGMIDDINKQLDDISAKHIHGDTDKAAFIKAREEVENILTDLLNKNPHDPKGIWEARKALDRTIEARSGESTWNFKSPLAKALKATRDNMNKSIKDVEPGVGDSLDKMSAMYYIRDPLTDKAAAKVGNIFSRLASEVGRVIGAQRDVAFGLGAVAGGALGYSTLGPAIMAVAGTAIGAGLFTKAFVKYGISPTAVKRHLGASLKTIDKAIVHAKEKGLTQSVLDLKADRAALLQAIQEGQDRWKNGGEEAFKEDQAKEAQERLQPAQ